MSDLLRMPLGNLEPPRKLRLPIILNLIAARLGSSQTSKTAVGDLKTPEEQYGVGSVEQNASPHSDPRLSDHPQMATPMTPLLDEHPLRRFHEFYSQAPWLYPQHVPHAPLPMLPPGQMMPPVQRPLFLYQDERIKGKEGRIGSSGFQVHERNLEMDRENQELKRNIERVLRENQLLRGRVDALAFQKDGRGSTFCDSEWL